MRLKGNLIVLLFLTFLLSWKCTDEKHSQIIFDAQMLENSLLKNNDRVMIFSCIRCGCFIETINNVYKKDKDFFQTHRLVTDTNCNKLEATVHYISQKTIDSLCEDIYNVTLFKKRNNVVSCRLIETHESDNFLEICKEFYD